MAIINRLGDRDGAGERDSGGPQKDTERPHHQGGRQIAAALLDIDGTKEEAEKKYDSYSNEAKAHVKEGMALTLLSNLTLPKTPNYAETIPKLIALGAMISDDEELVELLAQMQGFFTQYVETQEDLIQRLKSSRSAFQQKEAQPGPVRPELRPSPEQDPEFMKVLTNSSKPLKNNTPTSWTT